MNTQELDPRVFRLAQLEQRLAASAEAGREAFNARLNAARATQNCPRHGEDARELQYDLSWVQMELIYLCPACQREKQAATWRHCQDRAGIPHGLRHALLTNFATDRPHVGAPTDAYSTPAEFLLAAQAIGLDIAGIDLVAEDISRPLEGQRGMVIEVNAGPGMFMHIAPLHGRPRPVGEAIVALMFPPQSHGRIPIHAVADSPAAEAIARALTHILRRQGCRAGLATVEGIDIDGQTPYPFAGCDAERMLAVLTHPHAEAAVVVSRAADRLAHGLGVPRCDVAVLADRFPVASDPASGVIDPATMALLHALGDRGMAVVAAEAPGAEHVIYQLSICWAGNGEHLQAKQRVVVVGEAKNPLLEAHRRAGGPTVTREGARVLLAQGSAETALELAGSGTVSASGNPEPLLLAVAAAWAGGYSPAQLQNVDKALANAG